MKSRIKWIAASTVILLLAGCNPAPKYAKPPVQTPAAFKEVPAEFKEGTGWKLAQPGDDHLGAKWWQMYKDPQLNALEEQVKISNQSIAASEANFRAARALVISIRSAMAPTMTVSPSYTNSRFSSTAKGTRAVVPGGTGAESGTGSTQTGTAVGGSSTTGVFNNWSFPADISYTLDFWHKIRNTVAVNAFNAQASAADVATALVSTEAELAQDYFQVRAIDAQRRILENTVANYAQALELTKTLFKAGIDSDEEVAQAQTQLDTTAAQMTDLGVARATYEHAMATLIGKPAAEFALPVAEFVPNPPAAPVAVPSVLLERRPDIAAAERRVAAANAQIGVVRAAYYPDITLGGSGGFQTSTFSQWFTWPSRFWSIGPTVSEQIFDAGVRRAESEQARAQYEGTVATYRQTVLTAFQAVEDELSSLRILSQEIEQEHTAVNAANHYLDLATTRFRTGVDSYLNVITAQNSVLSAREAEVQIQLRQMTASVALMMALGGGWDTSQLPQGKQLSGKHPATQITEPPKGVQPVAVPNPPPLSTNSAVSGVPVASTTAER
ncbi:MAG: efflux transporter outer membrane subunit [Acidobacteriaceae bacterium]|nr:efflux transporter outer membrane subunit [Acidobacteriaceae bacterium]